MKHANILSVPQGTAVDWSRLPTLSIDCPAITESTSVTAFAQICRDDGALFLRLWAFEEEIRAEETGPLGTPCLDSCLEFFFCPIAGDSRYFNVEFNPKGCLYLELGSDIHHHTRLLPAETPESLFHPVIRIHSASWEIAYRIPYSFIRRFFPDFKPALGDSIRANFYKCADCGPNPHYLSWNPVTGTKGAVFHAPRDFGMLTFV